MTAILIIGAKKDPIPNKPSYTDELIIMRDKCREFCPDFKNEAEFEEEVEEEGLDPEEVEKQYFGEEEM
ncbi:MAG: hypothetical protein WC438_04260 [Candidatus Pacearchaeota archaeon]